MSKYKVEGAVHDVRLLNKEGWFDRKKKRAPRNMGRSSVLARVGVKYEEKFFNMLGSRYNRVYIHPWLEFEDDNGKHVCQPDAVLADPFIIFECKLSFKYRKAYSELKTLYKPVVESWLGQDNPKLVQVCKYLKPSARHTTVVHDMKEVKQLDKELLTWVWRPL